MRTTTLIVLIGLMGASCGQPSSTPSAGPEKPATQDELHMVCDEDGSSLAHGDPEYPTATVVDPEGIYTPAELDCLERVSGSSDYAEEPKGDPDPEAVARRRLEFGLIGGDEIVQAGYPRVESPVYVVIRDGDVVARTDLVRGSVGWYTGGYSACADYGN